MELTETVTLCIENDAFAARYVSGMAVNTMHNRFVDTPDGGTRWEMLAKFEFQGFPWKYISFIFHGSIRNRLREDMLNFREFVEQSEGVPPLPEEEPEDEHDEMDESENENVDDSQNGSDEEKQE